MTKTERTLGEIHDDIVRLDKRIAELRHTINEHVSDLERQAAKQRSTSPMKKFPDRMHVVMAH
jgi:hypothetical protein